MKRLYTLLAAVLLTASAFSQAPEKMSYQAVIRDVGNALVTYQSVGMQLSILQGSVSGTAVYVETQTPTTNINGLVSIEIGAGNLVSGDFTTIDWSAGPYFIKTETDPTGGTTYTITGTSQLMSVPFALHANVADSIIGGVSITETDPVFGASIANGITALDTANWNNHTVDTDTQLDSTGVAALGYVAEKTYTVGLWPELGGYVFRISVDGRHGLVAETQDQSTLNDWYTALDIISDPANHSTNGQKFMDWRLPTKYELNEMFNQKASIGGFVNVSYWSSTEIEFINSWFQNFSTGSQGFNYKYTTYSVRAVRAF